MCGSFRYSDTFNAHAIPGYFIEKMCNTVWAQLPNMFGFLNGLKLFRCWTMVLILNGIPKTNSPTIPNWTKSWIPMYLFCFWIFGTIAIAVAMVTNHSNTKPSKIWALKHLDCKWILNLITRYSSPHYMLNTF